MVSYDSLVVILVLNSLVVICNRLVDIIVCSLVIKACICIFLFISNGNVIIVSLFLE